MLNGLWAKLRSPDPVPEEPFVQMPAPAAQAPAESRTSDSSAKYRASDSPAIDAIPIPRAELERIIDAIVTSKLAKIKPRRINPSVIALANQLAGERPEDYAPATTPFVTRSSGLNEILAKIVQSMQAYTQGDKQISQLVDTKELRENIGELSEAFNKSLLDLFERYGSAPIPLKVPIRLTYHGKGTGEHDLVYRVKYLLDRQNNVLTTAICEVNGISPPPTYLVTIEAKNLGIVGAYIWGEKLRRSGNLSEGEQAVKAQRPLYISKVEVNFFIGAGREGERSHNHYTELTESSDQLYKNVPSLVSRLISEAEIPTHYIGLAALVAVLGSGVTIIDHMRGPSQDAGSSDPLGRARSDSDKPAQ